MTESWFFPSDVKFSSTCSSSRSFILIGGRDRIPIDRVTDLAFANVFRSSPFTFLSIKILFLRVDFSEWLYLCVSSLEFADLVI